MTCWMVLSSCMYLPYVLLGMQMMPHTGQRQDTERRRGAYRVELRGVLPPWVLDRLYAVLEDAQGGQLQVLRGLGVKS